MAYIDREISVIRQARYGKDMRAAIADAFEKLDAKIAEIESSGGSGAIQNGYIGITNMTQSGNVAKTYEVTEVSSSQS